MNTPQPEEAYEAPAKEVEVEVETAPGGQNGKKKPKAVVASTVAFLMDEIVPVPGTKIKVGLDPLFGLLPAGGDLASSSISCLALLEAVRRGLPFRAIRQMSFNIVLNAGVGTIPVVGDIFSLLYRSNSRNRDIIKANLNQAIEEGREPSWKPFIFVFIFVVSIVMASIALNIFLWYWLLSTLLGAFTPLL